MSGHTILVMKDDKSGQYTAWLGQLQNTSNNKQHAIDQVTKRARDAEIIMPGEAVEAVDYNPTEWTS